MTILDSVGVVEISDVWIVGVGIVFTSRETQHPKIMKMDKLVNSTEFQTNFGQFWLINSFG